jgi:beta-xylosidase
MRHSDNLNGTFTNPVIFADYPDPDIIRVGADFYMVSSSFHHAPGVPMWVRAELTLSIRARSSISKRRSTIEG